MKKNIPYLFLFCLCLSCASLQKAESDPFIGKYKMMVFNVDGVGDVPAILTIAKRKKMYYSEANYKIFEEERSLDVISTYSIDSSTMIIESFIDGYQRDFELNFENSDFTGIAGGYYKIEGKKIE